VPELTQQHRRRLPRVVLLLLVAGSFYFLRPDPARSQEGEGTPSPAVEAPGGAVSIEGRVQPQAFVDLALQSGGTVAEILVEEGQQVQAGAPLLRLDAAQQQIAVSQAQGRLDAAQAALEAAQTQQELAQEAVDTARAQAKVAEAQLALTQSGPLPEEIAAAQSRLAAAQSGVAQAVAARDALLENVGTEAQIESARADVAAATADLSALQDRYDTIIDSCRDTPQGTVCPLYGPVEENTRAQLQAAQARVDAAQTALERLQAGATAAQKQAADAGVSAAVAQREQAEAQLALLQAGATEEEIHQAQVAVSIAQAQVDVARAGLAEAQATVAQAEAGVQAAQAGVEAADLALARSTLEAPFAGVVASIDVNSGELVAPQAPVVTLADTSRWLVKTRNLTELDVARIAEGDEVAVTFDALPEAQVQGTITNIALSAGMDRGDVVYETTIALPEETDLPLRWGMTAVVELP
jgi:HlyD family secretion protein